MTKEERDKLLIENENLIYYVMKRHFPNLYMNLDTREEMYSIAMLGMIKAIDNWDPEISKFSTYMVPTIWGAIKRHLRDSNNIIRYSRSIKDLAYKLFKNNIDVNDTEAVNAFLDTLDLTFNEKLGVINYTSGLMSLDKTINEANHDESRSSTFGDTIASDFNVEEDISFNDYITALCKNKSITYKEVFKLMTEGYTQQEIGNEVSKSQTQVSRIIKHIRVDTIKLLIKTENYESALKMTLTLTNSNNIVNFSSKYRIALDAIPISIQNKYINSNEVNNMERSEEIMKTYSKKHLNTLIVKLMMKCILSEIEITKDNLKYKLKQFKKISNKHEIEECIDDITKSQFISFKDRAHSLINKYKFTDEKDFNLNINDFKTMKAKITSSYINTTVLSILNEFKNAISAIKL